MNLLHLKTADLPYHSYLVVSNPGLELFKNIHYAGKRFRKLNDKLSVEFLKAAFSAGCFKKTSFAELAELCVLRSGNYYGVDKAFMRYADSIPISHVGCTRKLEDGVFKANVYLDRTEILKEARHIVTSEIIATGSTFESLFKILPKNIKEWTIFSVAAAIDGCKKLNVLSNEYGIRTHLFVNCFIGNLADNKTDIPFYSVNKNPYLPNPVESSLRKHYGNEFFEAIKCCIGDGGNRFCNPRKHYQEILEIYSKMKFSERKSQRSIEKMLSETEHFLRQSERAMKL